MLIDGYCSAFAATTLSKSTPSNLKSPAPVPSQRKPSGVCASAHISGGAPSRIVQARCCICWIVGSPCVSPGETQPTRAQKRMTAKFRTTLDDTASLQNGRPLLRSEGRLVDARIHNRLVPKITPTRPLATAMFFRNSFRAPVAAMSGMFQKSK